MYIYTYTYIYAYAGRHRQTYKLTYTQTPTYNHLYTLWTYKYNQVHSHIVYHHILNIHNMNEI